MRQASAHAPIVVLSGFDDAMLRKEAEALGGVYYTKPLSADVMVKYIKEMLGR